MVTTKSALFLFSAKAPKKLLPIFICFLLCAFFPRLGYAAQVTVAWDPNAEPDLAGYKVYYGTSSGSYRFYLNAGKTTSVTVPNLQDATTYYFAATAYDATGDESGYSNEVSYTTPEGCVYSISPEAQSFASSGGPAAVTVSTQPGCAWTAVSNVPWVILTSNSSGTGIGRVMYTATDNPGGTARAGTLTVAGRSVPVTQAGTSCSFSVSPGSYSFAAKGGTGAGTILAAAGCAWSTSPGAAWITVTSGGNGAGKGGFSFSVAANPGTAGRTATLSVAGQALTITQSGAPASTAPAGGGTAIGTTTSNGTTGSTAGAGSTPSPSAGTGSGGATGVKPATAILDPYTKSILHFDGADRGTIFSDESGRTWTRVGNAATSAEWRKFGTASGYFSGGSDRIYTADHPDFAFAKENFTIDLWIKTKQSTQGFVLYQGDDSGMAGSVAFWVRMNGGRVDFCPDYRNYPNHHPLQSVVMVNDGQAHHVAAVRSGNTFTLYVDGAFQSTITLVDFAMTDSSYNLSIGNMGRGAAPYIGHVDELRISRGIARWTSNFIPPASEYGGAPANPALGAAIPVSPSGSIGTSRLVFTWKAVPGATWYYLGVRQPSGKNSGTWYTAAEAGCSGGTESCSQSASLDLDPGASSWFVQPYNDRGLGTASALLDFSIPPTRALLHFNGANGATTFLDETGRTWTRAGNAAIRTEWQGFGTGSAYFSGGSDRIYTADSADFAFGTENFTVDLWIKTTQSSSTQGAIVYQGDSAGNGNSVAYYISMIYGKVSFCPDYRSYPSHHVLSSLSNVNDGRPHHVAAVRNGDVFTLYVDGVAQSSVKLAGYAMFDSSFPLSVGNLGGGTAASYAGYVDELRISKGIARWTSDFTPPTGEYTE